MNNQLVIRLREIELTLSSEVDWSLFDGDGQHLCSSSSSPLAQLRLNANNVIDEFSIVVIVPGEAINLLLSLIHI